uniref:LRAT domain-containing protein n=1 Tax=Cannabis sativa TaxID=3483 RepID=A0A803PMX9_CANSA
MLLSVLWAICSGLGMVIRNQLGIALASETWPLDGCFIPEVAKVLAIHNDLIQCISFRLFRFEYNAGFSERILKKSGTCSAVSSDMAKKVTERAKDMLNSDNQFGEYHLIDNNCECFAFYCTTGLRRTMQGNAFKDAIESVYKTLMSGEHHSLKDISESLLRDQDRSD